MCTGRSADVIAVFPDCFFTGERGGAQRLTQDSQMGCSFSFFEKARFSINTFSMKAHLAAKQLSHDSKNEDNSFAKRPDGRRPYPNL